MRMLAEYDARNPDALKKLIGQGAKLSYFPKDLMTAAYNASSELFDELSVKNADFKAIYPKWQQFRQSEASWFRVAESALDNFTFAAVTKAKA